MPIDPKRTSLGAFAQGKRARREHAKKALNDLGSLLWLNGGYEIVHPEPDEFILIKIGTERIKIEVLIPDEGYVSWFILEDQRVAVGSDGKLDALLLEYYLKHRPPQPDQEDKPKPTE